MELVLKIWWYFSTLKILLFNASHPFSHILIVSLSQYIKHKALKYNLLNKALDFPKVYKTSNNNRYASIYFKWLCLVNIFESRLSYRNLITKNWFMPVSLDPIYINLFTFWLNIKKTIYKSLAKLSISSIIEWKNLKIWIKT